MFLILWIQNIIAQIKFRKTLAQKVLNNLRKLKRKRIIRNQNHVVNQILMIQAHQIIIAKKIVNLTIAKMNLMSKLQKEKIVLNLLLIMLMMKHMMLIVSQKKNMIQSQSIQ